MKWLIKLLKWRASGRDKIAEEPRTCAQCGRELPDHCGQFCDLCEAEILAQEIEFYSD